MHEAHAAATRGHVWRGRAGARAMADERDRRRTRAALTIQVQALLDEHYTGGRQQSADWLGQLDPADLASLARGMRALAWVAQSDGAEGIPDVNTCVEETA